MTLQQIRYMITIAETGSLGKAAEKLYVSQPSLTSAVKEMEKELGMTLFHRGSRGVTLTTDGLRLLPYARQVEGQYLNLMEAFGKIEKRKTHFAVSTQHYSFAVKAFVQMAQQVDVAEYELAIRETRTQEVISDVAGMRSEIGVLYMNESNRKPLMKLLEVIIGLGTSEETIETVREVGQRLGKAPITVKDSPAFAVNRMLVPMMNEAARLLKAGTASVEDIDTGARLGLNHPMGPLELMDLTGIDVATAAMETICRETGDPSYHPCQLLLDMRRMGWLGRKTGIGFYIYHEDGTRTPNPNL